VSAIRILACALAAVAGAAALAVYVLVSSFTRTRKRA
jgi:hypothetical protein